MPTVPSILSALIWIAILWKVQSYARRFLKMTLKVGTPPTEATTTKTAQIEFSLGRGLMTYLASMVILVVITPAFSRLATALGFGSFTLSGWFSTLAILLLIWHRHGSPPWRRALS